MRHSQKITATQHFFSLLKPRYLGMGFFWACSMLTFRTSNLFPQSIDLDLVTTTLLFFSFVFEIATLVAIAYLEKRKPGLTDELPSWLFVSMAIAGLGVLAASIEQVTGAVNLDLFMLGCVLIGISYAYFWAAWSQAYAKMHSDVTGTSLPFAFMLAVILYLAIPTASNATNLPIWVFMLPLPVLSAIFLYRCKREDNYDSLIIDNERGLVPAFQSIREILVAAVIFSFLFGFMSESSVVVLGSVNDTHRIPGALSLAAALLLVVLTTFGRRKWDINIMYEYGVPIIVIAFALFPIMFSTNATLVDSVMNGGYSILEILTWIIVATMSYDYRVSGAITGAIARIVFLLFRLIGIVAAYFIYQLVGGHSASPAMFSVLAIVAIWIWLMLSHNSDEPEKSYDHPHRLFTDEDYLPDYDDDDDESVRTVGQVLEEWAALTRSAAKTAEISDSFDSDYGDQRDDPMRKQDHAVESEGVSLHVAEKSRVVSDDESGSELHKIGDTPVGGLRAEAGEAERTYTIEELCAVVSAYYGLSRREAELLPYLAMGRSASYIADTLFISENTVRTHIKHIIEKTGAESKRAITDFVYEMGRKIIEMNTR